MKIKHVIRPAFFGCWTLTLIVFLLAKAKIWPASFKLAQWLVATGILLGFVWLGAYIIQQTELWKKNSE